MNPGSTQSSEASALASMFDAGHIAHVWRNDELEAVLAHQLAAPVSADLATLRGVSAGHVTRIAEAADPPIRTFRDLLSHPDPPLELLEWTRRFAKRARQARAGPPPEIAAVLYFGSILAARERRSANISKLADEQVRRGHQWILSQAWLDARTRALFDPAPEVDRPM